MKLKFLSILLFLFLTTGAKAQTIFTVAGDSTAGYNGDNIPAHTAELANPNDIAMDNIGNLYISDTHNNRIRKVTTSGIITTIAGTGMAGFSGDGGAATNAEIYLPFGIALDKKNNIFFCDSHNIIRKINNLTGIITTVAGIDSAGYNGDGISATAAKLNGPAGIALDSIGNVYIADYYNNRIRKVDTFGIITTYVGTGTAGYTGDNGLATLAEIRNPYGIAIDNIGSIYIADYLNFRVRMINSSGVITTIAGIGLSGYAGDGGPATAAQIWPVGLGVDKSGNIYVTDANNNVVRMINNSGVISTIAGTGTGFYNGDNQPATVADLHAPTGIAVDAKDNIYIADFYNSRIRYIQNTLSIKSETSIFSSIIIYPNPNTGSFFAKVRSTDDMQISFSIQNIIGETVKKINAYTNQQINIELNNPPGIYFLSANGNQKQWNTKIIIK